MDDIVYETKNVTCKAAMQMCQFAVEKATQMGIKINVSVTDKSGLEISFLRMEGSFIHSIEIAKDKAYTSSSFGFPTSSWTQIFKDQPHLEQGFSNRKRLIPFGGGFPVFINGELAGAIGVSGGTEEEDGICAQYALQKLGVEI
jgi:uncharacterized protein GlcG (DUF336 family)